MSGTPAGHRHPHLGVAVLGLVTITAYGSWVYAFGVLIGPIHDELGWSTTSLGIVYGAGHLLAGVGALAGGRLLDRFGCVAPFTLQAVVGGGAMFASMSADDLWVFGVQYALAAGTIGATGFYQLTTAAAGRIRASRPDKAIAALTMYGAFCSVIYLPLSAWLVESHGWRTAGRVLAVLVVVGALAAASMGRAGSTAGGEDGGGAPSARPLEAVRGAWSNPDIRRMLTVMVLVWLAYIGVIAYQVPILTGAGISLAAASVIGGLRGVGQVGLIGLVERVGSGRLLRITYAVSAVGVGFLLVGTVPAGVGFAIVGGAALGASSPLQAIYARTRFDARDLGLLMGLQGLATGLAGGLGPLIGGIIHDTTGSWRPLVAVAVVLLTLAAILTRVDRRPPVLT